MREIKFRAWDSVNNKIVTSGLAINLDTTGRVIPVSFSQGDLSYCRDNDVNKVPNVANEIQIMQYTGLKDKNGVEIYEGDIVKILYTDWPSQLDSHPELSHEEYLDSIALTRVVIWSVQGFYVSHKVDGYAESMEPGTHGYIEVIGNIWENSELLEAN